MTELRRAGENEAELGATASRGAWVTLAGQLVRFGLQILGLSALARLLDPADYGLVAIAIAFVGLGEVIRDFGLSSATIQAKSLTSQQKSNLFWINTAIGSVLCLGSVLAAGPIAAFYGGGDDLRNVIIALSATFIINGVSAQYRAQLNRELRFRSLAISGIAGPLVGTGLAIAVAANGAGVWALVTQQILVAIVSLAVMIGALRWFPSIPRRTPGMRPLLSYGGNLMLAQILIYFSRNTDSIIIGKRFGAEVLGFYDRAFQMLMLPLNQLNAPSTSVALPILSKLHGDKANYDRFLLRGQTVMVTVVAGIFTLLAPQAQDVVRVVLGPGWRETASLFAILAAAGVLQAVGYATYWVFLSTGKTRSNFYFTLCSRPITILLIVGGSTWGVRGVALGYVLGLLINWVFGLWWVGRFAGAPAGAMFRQGARTIGVSLIVGASVWATRTYLLENFPIGLRIAVSTLLFFVTLFIVAVASRSFRADVYASWMLAKQPAMRIRARLRRPTKSRRGPI